MVQLIQDYEDYAEVNKQLEKMGYNIGIRLIEDFLAKSAMGRCADFKEVGEVVSKVCLPIRRSRTGISPSLCDLDALGWIQIFSQYHTDCHARHRASTIITEPT